jgi:hypothetical protein
MAVGTVRPECSLLAGRVVLMWVLLCCPPRNALDDSATTVMTLYCRLPRTRLVLAPQLLVGRDCIIREGARRARPVRLICSLLIGGPVGKGAIFGRERSSDGKPDAVIASGFILQVFRRARDIPMTYQ